MYGVPNSEFWDENNTIEVTADKYISREIIEVFAYCFWAI